MCARSVTPVKKGWDNSLGAGIQGLEPCNKSADPEATYLPTPQPSDS